VESGYNAHLELIMKLKGPALTLLGGLVLAGALLGVNIAANRAEGAETGAVKTNATASESAATSTRGLAAPAPAEATPSASATPSAPAGGRQSAPVTYAGRVDGGGAAIAIAVRDGQGLAYVCDGKRLEAWLQGGAGDGQLALTGANGASLTGTYDATAAKGSVTVAGRTYTFRITVVQAPSGLYRIADKVANASAKGGWIVDGEQQTGTLTVDGVTRPAPPLNPQTGEVTINGVTVKPGRV
jgi:hypothetical protein